LESVSKPSVIYLSNRVKSKSGLDSHNFFVWYEYLKNVKLGEYGERIMQQFRDENSPRFNLEEELNALGQIESLLPVTESFFILSPAQRVEMAALPEAEREDYKKLQFIEWANARALVNATITQENHLKMARITELNKNTEKYLDLANQVFSGILSLMTVDSRNLVERYIFNQPDEEEGAPPLEYTFAMAQEESNWFFLIVAARATHVERRGALDDYSIDLRRDQEEQRLKKLKHVSGKFMNFLTHFENQLEQCESVGLELSEERKCRIFIESLNDSIFEDLKKAYTNIVTASTMPRVLGELKLLAVRHYQKERMLNVERVEKVENRGSDERREHSLKSFESKEPHDGFKSDHGKPSDQKTRCDICDKNHLTENCKFRNTKFSIESNRKYFERRSKSKESGGGNLLTRNLASQMIRRVVRSTAHLLRSKNSKYPWRKSSRCQFSNLHSR
jgi:hypothetical protein